MSNVLDLVDQTIFRVERAAGVTNLIQCVWVYNRPVDIDGLRRFHHQLRQGRLSRRIERSPLPFGRHRWVSPSDQPELEIVATPRPREEFDAWLGEQANTPLDAEHGPGWHLAVLPFTDGGAGVSLVASHCLTDGVGLCEAVADAASGHENAISWPAAGSRPRWQAVREDARQTVRDIPAIGRAVAAAARFVRRNAAARGQTSAHLPSPAGADERITAPNGNDLRRRRRVGRPRRLTRRDQQHAARGICGPPRPTSGTWRHDGSVTLTMPINERIPRGDTRANAITNVDITVDPAPATTDLREIRAATKQALIRSQGGARRTVDTVAPRSHWCPSSSASACASVWPPTVRPTSAHPTSVRSTRPPTGQTAQTPTTSPCKRTSRA